MRDGCRLIDMSDFTRAGAYIHFMRDIQCPISLCDDIDVTALYSSCRETHTSFYISVLWCVSAVINAHEEFRLTAVDSPDSEFPLPAVYDTVSPYHNIFHPETESVTGTFTLYSEKFADFLSRCGQDIAAARAHDFSVPAPTGTFEASCVPWRHFTAVDAGMTEYDLSPLVVWGGIKEQGKKKLMPLSIKINHAAADGFHLARFINETEEKCAVLAAEILNKD